MSAGSMMSGVASVVVANAPAAAEAAPTAAPRDHWLKGLRLVIVADSSSTHTVRWSQWFAGRGSKVTVISHVPDGIAGVEVIEFPGKRKWYHKIPKVRTVLDYRPFHELLRQIDPQLVHIHFVSEGGRAFYWDRVEVPIIASSWGQDVIFDNGPFRGAEGSLRRVFAKSKLITATTHQLAEATTKYTPAGKPIYIIPFGVDLSRFEVKSDEAGEMVTLGFVKHLLPKYGPDVLVEAFALIHQARPKTRLVLAGRGTMREQLERRIEELGVKDAVEILGRVPHEKVPGLIRSFDLMVMPSVYESETFGVAAIEASASGVPVVASRVGGVPEAVIHGKTGLLVPPRDVKALAEACIELIDEPDRRREMGLAGRRFVERYYVWGDNCGLMEEVYRAALEGEAPAGVPVYRPGVAPDLLVPA